MELNPCSSLCVTGYCNPTGDKRQVSRVRRKPSPPFRVLREDGEGGGEQPRAAGVPCSEAAKGFIPLAGTPSRSLWAQALCTAEFNLR